MADLAPRLKNRVQLTTDAMSGYPAAVAKHFGKNMDYGVLNKSYAMPVPTKEASIEPGALTANELQQLHGQHHILGQRIAPLHRGH